MNKQANARTCFVCGVNNRIGLRLKFYQTNPGEVFARITISEEYQGYPGVVHGGIVAAMLDEVAGRTFMTGDPPRFMFTARLSIRYRRPVPVGKPLLLKGHLKADKGRVGIAVGEIYDETDNLLLAEGEVVLTDIPADVLAKLSPDPGDWMVYPDGGECEE